ncbi:MAG: hypothetical protein R6V03_05915 [Kiritimatiellia bacterium]
MKRQNTEKLVMPASLLILTAGVLAAVLAVAGIGTDTEELKRKVSLIEELQGMNRALKPCEEALAAFNGLEKKRPPAMSAILADRLPRHKPQSVTQSATKLTEGWTLVMKEVTFSEIPVGKAMFLAREAERAGLSEGAPPWRLRRCSVRPSPGNPGSGQAALTFEALRKDAD